MRLLLLLSVALFALAAACTNGGDGETPTPDAEPTPSPTAFSTLYSAQGVIAEIADQLFASETRPVHIFGLNVEDGEEFVFSGRDRLPRPPDTDGWTAEFEGAGVWIVDTGSLIYRFEEGDMSFDVIYEYGAE